VKLSIHLTNENTKASGIFAKSSVAKLLVHSINQRYALLTVSPGSDDYKVNLDVTILALGLMINLAEFSDRVRISVIEDGDEVLNETIKLFLHGKERAEQAVSEEESLTNVAFAYLAFMLGNLCHNELMRLKIQSQLPGGNLALLINTMYEFSRMIQVTDKMAGSEEGEEMQGTFTRRFQAMVDALKALEG